MILDKLQAASFEGIEFLVPTNRTTDGRKTVTHEFVNSNERYVEEVGRFQPKFNVTAIVHGADAIQRRDALRAVLNKSGTGILIHPSYGKQAVVVEGQYTIAESDTELGEYRFEIVFARSTEAVFPRAQQSTPATVAASEQTARKSLLDRLSDQWLVPASQTSNADAASKLSSYASQVQNSYAGIVDDASAIVAATKQTITSATAIVRSGSDLANSVGAILDSLDQIPTETLATLSAIKSLTSFGADDQDINNKFGLYSDQSARIFNRGLLNSAVQATALTKAYTTSTLVDFQVVNRLDANRTELAQATRTILNTIRSAGVQFDAASAAGVAVNTSRNREAVNDVLDTRAAAETILADREQNLYRVVQIRQPLTSSRLLSYALFEDDSATQLLADLNLGQRPSVLTGRLEAVNR